MYSISIKNEAGEEIAEISMDADSVIQLLAENLSDEDTSTSETVPKKKKKDEESGGGVSKRSRLTDEQTTQIEDMLKAGDSVADICASVGVSNPTVYVIRARLKTSGEIPD